MPLDKKADAEPIPGYRLMERLGSGGFGEVWKCEAPGGIFKAIKFVHGNLESLDSDSHAAENELRALQHIKSIRHPFLLSIDRVESINGELVIVTELADCNLYQLWEKYHERGLPGIPRTELLGYLREAAEVLDLLNQKFDLQHLDIKPRNLFLVSNHVKVADFGLVNSLMAVNPGDSQVKMGAVTPQYASPELFNEKMSRHSDQYSLAIVFQELLTGTMPFQGKNLRQLLAQHTQQDPELHALPETDRAVVARALAKNPDDRFPSCLDFVRALQNDSFPQGKTFSDMAVPAMPAKLSEAGSETIITRNGETLALRTAPPPPMPKSLSNYRLTQPVVNSPLMEVWKAQNSEGQSRLVKFLFGFSGKETAQVKERAERLLSIQHPALLDTVLLHVEPGRLILSTPFVRESVRDRFTKCQSRKQSGIARSELIDYLRAAAEVLDYLHMQHNIYHLNLSPRTMVLDQGWLQLTEFGYAQVFWLPEGQDIANRNARYAAPELFEGTVSRQCDQYSLALIYAEMLTGVHPFRGRSPASYRRDGSSPELQRLPEWDRGIIARALHADPTKRWPSCTEMLLALEGTSAEAHAASEGNRDYFAKLLENDRSVKRRPIYTGVNPTELNAVIAQIIVSAGGDSFSLNGQMPQISPNKDEMRHEFQAGLPIGAARAKLGEYCARVYGTLVEDEEDHCTIRFQFPGNFWQSWTGRQPALDMSIKLARSNPRSATPVDVVTTIRTRHCGHKRSKQLLESMSNDLVEMLQQHLLINSEKRTQDRLLWPQTLRVIPLLANGQCDEPIECRGKDISQSGMGFFLPHELHTSEVLIELPNTIHPPTIAVPAVLVRAKRCSDGWYEVGALFRLPTQRRSMAEICI